MQIMYNEYMNSKFRIIIALLFAVITVEELRSQDLFQLYNNCVELNAGINSSRINHHLSNADGSVNYPSTGVYFGAEKCLFPFNDGRINCSIIGGLLFSFDKSGPSNSFFSSLKETHIKVPVYLRLYDDIIQAIFPSITNIEIYPAIGPTFSCGISSSRDNNGERVDNYRSHSFRRFDIGIGAEISLYWKKIVGIRIAYCSGVINRSPQLNTFDNTFSIGLLWLLRTDEY